jgi:hypothetical protein
VSPAMPPTLIGLLHTLSQSTFNFASYLAIPCLYMSRTHVTSSLSLCIPFWILQLICISHRRGPHIRSLTKI